MKNKTFYTLHIGRETLKRDYSSPDFKEVLSFSINDMERTNIYVETIAHAKRIARAIASPYFAITTSDDSFLSKPVFVSPAYATAKQKFIDDMNAKEKARVDIEHKAVKRINASPKCVVIYDKTVGEHSLTIVFKRGAAEVYKSGYRDRLELKVEFDFIVYINGSKVDSYEVDRFKNFVTSSGSIQHKRFASYYETEFGDDAKTFAADLRNIVEAIINKKHEMTSLND